MKLMGNRGLIFSQKNLTFLMNNVLKNIYLARKVNEFVSPIRPNVSAAKFVRLRKIMKIFQK